MECPNSSPPSTQRLWNGLPRPKQRPLPFCLLRSFLQGPSYNAARLQHATNRIGHRSKRSAQGFAFCFGQLHAERLANWCRRKLRYFTHNPLPNPKTTSQLCWVIGLTPKCKLLTRCREQIVEDTLFFSRWEISHSQFVDHTQVPGYGHEFEKAFTRFELEDSSGYQRIIQYNLGGIECLVRFEVDGYLDGTVDAQPTQTLSSISLDSMCYTIESEFRGSLSHNLRNVGLISQILDLVATDLENSHQCPCPTVYNASPSQKSSRSQSNTEKPSRCGRYHPRTKIS